MKKTLSLILFGLVVSLFGNAGSNTTYETVSRSARQETLPILRDDKATKVSDGDYVLVNSLDDLVVGRNVIIAVSAYNYAMSATQSTNNRARVAITKTTSGSYSVATWSSNVGVFTLKEGTITGTYAFYDSTNSGYLTSYSSSKNYLKTTSSLTANASFAISFSGDDATITAQGSYTRNTIKYNSSSSIFSCYSSSSSQKAVSIYQQYVATTEDESTTDEGSVEEEETTSEITFSPSDFSSSYTSATITKGDYSFYEYYVSRYSTSYLRFYRSYGYLQNTDAISGLKSITLTTYSGRTFSGTLYSGTTAGATTHSQSVTNGNTYTITSGDTFFKLKVGSSTGYLKSITLTYVETPVNPTAISLTPSTMELKPGATQQLSVGYTPTNANANLGVTYTSSNDSVASVSSSGLVSVPSTATAGATATITATSTYSSSIKATAIVTVKEASTSTSDAWTIMIYMCGADLESTSSYRLATGDIKEILSISGQPEDVNIIIETGGASSWASTYGISANYLQRWHVENQSLVLDESLTKASMGLTSTFQSFLEWGLTNYPAEKTGVIMWNHGGAMRGVCYDENYSDDSLLNSEVNSAISGAFSSLGRTEKLEFIGYDACLMQVQDIAEFNSQYFNYMVASEESEAGYGWDYDTWVDDLYSLKSTSTILKAIVDGFITDNGGTSSSSNDQTLSYLDLSYMEAYKTAWENMATALSSKLTSSNKSSFNTLVKSAKYYSGSSYYQYYGIFDAKDFVTKLAANSTFNPGSTYTDAVLTAFANLVAYSSCGKGAGNSYGLCMFWAVSSNCVKSTYYASTQTNFTNWRSLVTTYGN